VNLSTGAVTMRQMTTAVTVPELYMANATLA
jgi:hypothetical protein